MNVSIGSDGAHHRYRKNIVYRSLRRSSSQIITNIKKKINEAEKTVRHRRALRPLNESRSPSPLPQVRIIAPPAVASKKNVYTTPNAVKLDLDGYEFDNDSNILRTPDQESALRNPVKKGGVIAQLRELSTLRPLKKRPQQNNTPVAIRLAKQLARTRIRNIQSPRNSLLKSAEFIGGREGDPLPGRSGLQGSYEK